MYHIENITEEQLLSKTKRKSAKDKEFREYLVSHNVVSQIVKYLITLRNSKEDPDAPQSKPASFLGGSSPDTSALELLQIQIEAQKELSSQLRTEIDQVGSQIALIKEARQRKLEEEEKVRVEQEAVKAKKGGKK